MPALRDRQEDVPALADRLLQEACAARGRAPREFTNAARALLGAWTWPGNLKELQDVVERLKALGAANVREFGGITENVTFHLPKALSATER